MAGINQNLAGIRANVNRDRFREHDELEEFVMDAIRPITTRKHLPDRFVSISGVLCPFDVKTTVNCEDNSHDEYQQLFNAGYGLFIVYRDRGVLYADWFDKLKWDGPKLPTLNSRSMDRYYRISGGRLFNDWKRSAIQEAKRFTRST